jgi:hypothetical protein
MEGNGKKVKVLVGITNKVTREMRYGREERIDEGKGYFVDQSKRQGTRIAEEALEDTLEV